MNRIIVDIILRAPPSKFPITYAMIEVCEIQNKSLYQMNKNFRNKIMYSILSTQEDSGILLKWSQEN